MKWKITIGAMLMLGVGAWYWLGSAAKAASAVGEGELFTLRRDDLAISITENGTMVAKESKKVAPKIRGESKITFLVEEGKEVAEGEVVCKLDPTSVEANIEQLQLEILQTEAALKSARAEFEIHGDETVALLAKSKVALDRSHKELEKYRDGEAPQQRKKLDVAIKDTETDFNRAKKNLEDSQKLVELNYIKKSELEDHQIEFERAVVQKEGAELDLRIFEKYTLPMQMTDLETKVTDAVRDVGSAAKRGETRLGEKEVVVQQAEKRLKAQQKQLTERKEDLENMSLKAPCPGIVVYGDPHEPWYRQQVKVGSQVYGSFTVMTIPDLRVLQVKIQIHEADIDKIKPGLPVTVTMDTYVGRVLRGEVSRIATIASGENEWGGSATVKKFDVEITIQSEVGEEPMRPGISAKAEIHIDKRPQVLFVPLQCVFSEGGEQFCHVMAPGKGPLRRRIDIGLANDTYVEVRGGLEERERVLLYNPLLPESRSDGENDGRGDKVPAASSQEKPGTSAAKVQKS